MKRASLRDFEQTLKTRRIRVFTTADLVRIFGWKATAVRFLIHRYAKRGIVLRLKRDLYMLAGTDVAEEYVANRLYDPSYVSLESALSLHGIIPEMVYAVTSVTSKTTRRFSVADREYDYHHIKVSAFAGYVPTKRGEYTCLVAEPEKALLDYYYLVVRGQRKPLDLERLRLDGLRPDTLREYAALFGDLRVTPFLNQILARLKSKL